MTAIDYHAQDKFKKLTRADLASIDWALKFVARCLPPENRNQSKNGACQDAFDKLRTARKALKKVRELKGQGL